jgi:hypothetical protein
MDNNYFTTVNPYFAQQDQQGLNPVFQNIAQQQANQNMALQQGMNLTNQAGMTTEGKQAGAGMNPIAMAQMLRKPQTGADAAKMNEFGAYMPWNQMSTANQYGTDPYSQQSLMLASQDLGMK